MIYICIPMRYEKDNTRRIGGLFLDLLMLSFIISFSLADVKIADGYSSSGPTATICQDDHIIVHDFHSIFGSFLKQISQAHPDNIQSLGVIFDFPNIKDAEPVVFANTQYLYNTIYTNTTINAP